MSSETKRKAWDDLFAIFKADAEAETDRLLRFIAEVTAAEDGNVSGQKAEGPSRCQEERGVKGHSYPTGEMKRKAWDDLFAIFKADAEAETDRLVRSIAEVTAAEDVNASGEKAEVPSRCQEETEVNKYPYRMGEMKRKAREDYIARVEADRGRLPRAMDELFQAEGRRRGKSPRIFVSDCTEEEWEGLKAKR